MRTTRSLPQILGTLLLPLSQALPAQGPIPQNDPVFGVWELDVARSIYTQREKPVAQRRIYERTDEGVKTTIISTTPSGRTSTLEYVAPYDGAPSPLSGTAQADSVVLQRVGPRSAMATLSHAGLEVGKAERTISQDGREMTIRVELKGDVSSMSYYRKVE